MKGVSSFERSEFWADYGMTPDYQERESFLLAHLPPTADSVIDIGCGNGSLIKRIQSETGTSLVIGLDSSEAALRRQEFHSIVGRLPSLPFPADSFDVVICLEVLEHIPDTDSPPAAAELGRIARKKIFLGVPYREKLLTKTVTCGACGWESHAEGHLRSFCEQDLHGLIPGWQLESATVLGKKVKRIPDWLSRFRRRFLGHSYQTDNFTCPHCASMRVKVPDPTPWRLARFLGSIFVRSVTVTLARKPYWIIGQYRPVPPTCEILPANQHETSTWKK